MCYSAQIQADYKKYVRQFRATLSIAEFTALFAFDPYKKRPKTPKAMDDAFRDATAPEEAAIALEIAQWDAVLARYRPAIPKLPGGVPR